jgi:hypothetical protein
MIAETVALWFFAACGASIMWSATEAVNCMKETDGRVADRWGWSMTGMVGFWAALQPFVDKPVPISIPVVVMALSLAVQSWRLAHAYRVDPSVR